MDEILFGIVLLIKNMVPNRRLPIQAVNPFVYDM